MELDIRVSYDEPITTTNKSDKKKVKIPFQPDLKVYSPYWNIEKLVKTNKTVYLKGKNKFNKNKKKDK